MKRLRHTAILAAMSVCYCGALAASSLLGPAVDSFLHGRASSGEVSCVLSTTGGREVVYSRWADYNQPVPVGSLVKPFTALAYAASHGGRFPRIECKPESGCWLPSGHGAVGIEQAIGYSCNAYFRSLSEQLQARDLAPVTARFGLPAPPLSALPGAYFGLGDEWRLAPVALVRAYEELLRRSAEPAISRVLAGLKLAGEHGTASGVARALGGLGALAKTGTAPCIHTGPSHRSNGDGYALVLYPTDQPRYTLLVRVHGVPGREAANLAGEILKVVAGHPAP
ncbi:MAG: penicillin-binding transpeptidase domain-containing protein [Bryobacterales bacterium]